LVSDSLLTTLHPLLKNVLETIDHFKISCIGAPFHNWKSPENHRRQDFDRMVDVLMEFHQPAFSKLNTEFNSDLTPHDFWASPTVKRELQGKKF
jgi:hypothetical protein